MSPAPKLQTGQLSKQEYHGQLLRLIYRFLFLFTAEDRSCCPARVDRDDPRRQIYREGYSVGASICTPEQRL